MALKSIKPESIDQYIADFPKEVADVLQIVRETVRKAAPAAIETIKYAMPAFIQDGDLVYFAAFKNHIGFYPAPTGHKAFEKALSVYKTGRGSVQFPLDRPMPLSLIGKIVRFRLQQNREKINQKSNKGHIMKTASKEQPFAYLSQPAQRALSAAGITTLAQLSGWTEKALLQLHGIGKTSLPPLRTALEQQGLSFAERTD